MNAAVFQHGKTANKIRAIVMLVLLVILLFASLGPIVSIPMDAELNRRASDGMELFVGTSVDAFPETVHITPINMVKAAFLLARLKIYSESGSFDAKVKMSELLFKETQTESQALAIIGICNSFGPSETEEDRQGNFGIAVALISVAVLILVGTSITFLVGVIRMIIAVATENPDTTKKAIAGQWVMGAGMGFFCYFAIFQHSGIGKVGWGPIVMLICEVLYIVLSFVLTRLRAYRKQDLACVNLVQLCSLGGLLGGIFFLVGTLMFEKPGLIFGGTQNELFARLVDSTVVVFCLWAFAFVAYNWFNINLNRIAQTRNWRTWNNPVASIFSASWNFVFLIVTVGFLFATRNYIIPLFYNGLDKQFASGTKIAIVLFIIGSMLTLATEIVLKVLLKKKCPELANDDVIRIYAGMAEYPADAPAQKPEAAPAQTQEAPAQPVQPAANKTETAKNTKFDRLAECKRMKDAGLITEEEYEAKKQQILNQ